MLVPLFEASLNNGTQGCWTQSFCTQLLALLSTSVENWMGQCWFKRFTSGLNCQKKVWYVNFICHFYFWCHLKGNTPAYSSLANDGSQKENCDNKPARRKNCVTKPPIRQGGQGLAAVEKHSMHRSEVAEWKTASPNPP